MRALLVAAVIVLAGCLGTDEIGPTNEAFPVETWYQTWQVTDGDFFIDHDPGGRHNMGTGWIEIRNERGEDTPTFEWWLPAYEEIRFSDANGEPLAASFSLADEQLEGFDPPVDTVVLDVAPYVEAKIQLTGDTNPGAVQRIRVEFAGWVSEVSSAPGGAPASTSMVLWSLTGGPAGTWGQWNTHNVTTTVSHPLDWTVVLPGTPVSNVIERDRRIQTHTGTLGSEAASSQGIHLLAETYDGLERPIDVRTYYFPNQIDAAQKMHGVTLRALNFLEANLAPFPFDHIWSHPMQTDTANAYSRPGLSFFSTAFYESLSSPAPFQLSRLSTYAAGQNAMEMVTVHEHTHNYFAYMIKGNQSYEATTYQEIWLSEGLTTYMSELVWFDQVYGRDAGKSSADAKVIDQAGYRRASAAQNGREIREYGANEIGGDYYEKGAMMVRALEAYGIATDRPHAVLEGLRKALGHYDGSAEEHSPYGMTSEEAVASFEAAFGERLDWHFNSWLWTGHLSDFTVVSVDGAEVMVANIGAVKGAVSIETSALDGSLQRGWLVLDAGQQAPFNTGGVTPVVSVQLDVWQHVYEADETNNVWTMPVQS